MSTTRPHCTGTESLSAAEAKEQGLFPADWSMYGRRMCTTCHNIVFPKADGQLRKHVAKRWND